MTKFTILGCGSSLGSPWITNNWGKLNKNNKFNIRTRCSAHIKKGDLSILIDTSPDIKKQILDNKIKNIDGVLYTHEHADQTSCIFELRPFFWQNKKPINIYADAKTLNQIIIAAPKSKKNNKLISLIKKNKFNFYRGSETNVLKRYYFAAKKFKADAIVRITSDNP